MKHLRDTICSEPEGINFPLTLRVYDVKVLGHNTAYNEMFCDRFSEGR
jgi:hypothetical protein